jgi:hypothetical protein
MSAALIASWATFGVVSAAVFTGVSLVIPSLREDRKRAGFLVVASMWVATFRKNAPMVYHLRGLLSLASRASLALTRGRGFQHPGDTLTTRHRVLLGDLDFNLHQNNACYPAELDVQRFGFLVDLFTGHVPYALPLLKWGWKLANGGVSTWFLVEIRLDTAYDIKTRLAGIDGKWFYLRSDYVTPTTLHAVAITRIVVKIGRKTIPPAEALERLGYAVEDIRALTANGSGENVLKGFKPDVVIGPGMSELIKAILPAAAADTPRGPTKDD